MARLVAIPVSVMLVTLEMALPVLVCIMQPRTYVCYNRCMYVCMYVKMYARMSVFFVHFNMLRMYFGVG